MPSIEKHVEISTQRTNQSYREVHEWIDDPKHKDARHNITKIPDTFSDVQGKVWKTLKPKSPIRPD